MIKFSYINIYHANVRATSFEALYGQEYKLPVHWAKVGWIQLAEPWNPGKNILNQQTTITRQESYAKVRQKPCEISIGIRNSVNNNSLEKE